MSAATPPKTSLQMRKLGLAPPRRGRLVGVAAAGLIVGGGMFAWHLYSRKNDYDGPAGHERLLLSSRSQEPEYLFLPSHLGERFKEGPVDAKEELKSMLPKHLRKPWKLLRQANWGDYEKHLLAVRDLANLSSLSDGEYRQLAQSCAMRTAVGLARTKNVDLRFFLPPPAIPLSVDVTSTAQLFKKLLSALPNENVHDCIRFFTTEALHNYVAGTDEESIIDIDLDYEFHRNSDQLVAIPRKRFTESRLVEYCLQALLSHSTVEQHSVAMVEMGCLALFAKIVQEHPRNPVIKSLVGKILANISLHPENHSAIFATGFVGILARWKQDPNLLVTLPATKALCNLDQQFCLGMLYPGMYQLLPETRNVQHLNELSNWGIDIIFLHGLLGGVFYSWRQLDSDNSKGWGTTNLVSSSDYSYCWPRDWLSDISDHVRVLGVDFDTYLSQWGNTCPNESFKTSLQERSADVLQKLHACGVGKRPVIFVGHSMGGLIIKQILRAASSPAASEEDKELVKNTRGVVFYSTPHAGSRIARMNSYSKYLFFPTTEVLELEEGSPHLLELHQSFLDLVKSPLAKGMEVISFGETVPTPYLGLDLTFVPPESSNPGHGKYYPLEMNHMNICKPSNRRSILFRKLHRLIIDAVDETMPFE